MKTSALASLVLLFALACGGASPPTSAPSFNAASGSPACALGVDGARATVTDTPSGVVVTIVGGRDVADLRMRARSSANVHGPDAHEGPGHGKRHGMGGDHGLRAIDLPAMQATVADIDGGARIELTPMNPGDADALRAKARERAVKMNRACDVPPG